MFPCALFSFDRHDHAGVPSVEMSPAVRDAVDALLQQWGKEAALRCIALAYKELPSGQSTFTHADEQDLESVVDVRDESEIVHAVGVVAAEGHHPGRDAQQEVELHGQ